MSAAVPRRKIGDWIFLPGRQEIRRLETEEDVIAYSLADAVPIGRLRGWVPGPKNVTAVFRSRGRLTHIVHPRRPGAGWYLYSEEFQMIDLDIASQRRMADLWRQKVERARRRLHASERNADQPPSGRF